MAAEPKPTRSRAAAADDPHSDAAAAASKSAGTRKGAPKRKSAAPASDAERAPLELALEYAEKAVLVPVGAILVARDGLRSALEEIREEYATSTAARAQLQRFERRGEQAKRRFERAAEDGIASGRRLAEDIVRRLTDRSAGL